MKLISKLSKEDAGWVALGVAIVLVVDSAVARWFPGKTSSGNEVSIIIAMLSFSASAFGFSSLDLKNGKK